MKLASSTARLAEGASASRPHRRLDTMRLRGEIGRLLGTATAQTLALGALGAVASVLMTGFVVGSSNNLFHLPIVASLYDEPQFARDTFVQSLRFFASGVWLLLRGAASDVDIHSLFLGLHVASRFLTFLGLLLCAELVGITGLRKKAIFTALIGLTTLMRGASYAGSGGLFFSAFTHSEIANGLSLLMIYLLVRGRIGPAFALNGLVFFVNAFVAVWNVVPILLLCLYKLRSGEIGTRSMLKQGTIGLVLAVVPSVPVIANVVGNPEFGQRPSFDYPSFLMEYYPNHFLVGGIPVVQLFAAASITALTVLSLWMLRPSAKPLLIALGGYILVYLIGVVMPTLTSSHTLMNLHLLRVSTFFHIFASLGALAVLTNRIVASEGLFDRACAALLFVSLCTVRALALAAPVLLLLMLFTPSAWRRAVDRLAPPAWIERAGLGFIAAIVLVVGVQAWQHTRKLVAVAGEWESLGEWARSHTDLHDVFMVPVIASAQSVPAPREVFEVGTSKFEFVSRRRVWVDFQRGAAVMWSPSYYPEWHGKVSEISALNSIEARIGYARSRNIAYVIELCARMDRQPAVFRTGNFCVVKV